MTMMKKCLQAMMMNNHLSDLCVPNPYAPLYKGGHKREQERTKKYVRNALKNDEKILTTKRKEAKEKIRYYERYIG